MRHLLKKKLKGKVALRIAGDLHHYTRHIPNDKNNTRRSSRNNSSTGYSPLASAVLKRSNSLEPPMKKEFRKPSASISTTSSVCFSNTSTSSSTATPALFTTGNSRSTISKSNSLSSVNSPSKSASPNYKRSWDNSGKWLSFFSLLSLSHSLSIFSLPFFLLSTLYSHS